MKLCIPLENIETGIRREVGGKAFALARMANEGFSVPRAMSVTSAAYRQYVELTGLGERIGLELNRKDFHDMRWEEVWDASLRIRNLFLNTPMPRVIEDVLSHEVGEAFADVPVVVRSSAPGEDSAKTSFAGLHESYVNVRGTDAIVEHIRKVWASLWSDGALLYRQELGLDYETSSMAVLIQEIVVGDRSGVAFSRNPNDPEQSVIEAVYGLNQGLVDGTLEPDRWTLERNTATIISHRAGSRDQRMVPSSTGVRLEALEAGDVQGPLLSDEEVSGVFGLAMRAEHFFGRPQDVEWTYRERRLYVLQSRPITTLSGGSEEDKRPWYLSLKRSLGNLETLRKKIEEKLIPTMIQEAENLALSDLKGLADEDLALEIVRRKKIYDDWYGIYYRDFIPFAHGFRLFGQVYNDTMEPSDPHEFIDLLSDTGMVSVERNRRLGELAVMIRENSGLRRSLEQGNLDFEGTFKEKVEAFMEDFRDLSWESSRVFNEEAAFIRFLLEMASSPAETGGKKSRDVERLQKEFLRRFQDVKRTEMEAFLDLARTSYRLRDDDNIYLGKIEGRMLVSVHEGQKRIFKRSGKSAENLSVEDVIKGLRDSHFVPQDPETARGEKKEKDFKPRQLVGQPAGPGLGRGAARVIREATDLMSFKAGEILVCDAIDPNMTFVVPLSAGIVERRGGMLIHGAIIAREYGLPCVTGVPEAVELIHTGDKVTVDGYLGIVIIG